MLTVLLATYNGAGTLPAVLAAYQAVKEPPGGWTMVVVDNGSSDATAEIIRSFSGRLPLKYVCEPERGKNAGLNTGLQHVEGDLVVLTDDDVFPAPDWLIELRNAADMHPEFAVFCGVILPRWQSPPAAGLLQWAPAGPTYTLTNPLLEEGPTEAHNVLGPNMAVRRAVFNEGHRFSTSVGPRGKSYPMGSETEFVRRILSRGYRAWYVRRAVVEHLIRSGQVHRNWVLARAIRFGRGQYRLRSMAGGNQLAAWRGVPRYLYRALLENAFAVARACCRLESAEAWRHIWVIYRIRGEITEARIIHRERVDS